MTTDTAGFRLASGVLASNDRPSPARTRHDTVRNTQTIVASLRVHGLVRFQFWNASIRACGVHVPPRRLRPYSQQFGTSRGTETSASRTGGHRLISPASAMDPR